MASRSDWSLDPQVTFLNHGSFGPTPRVVQQARLRYLEDYSANSMKFLVRDLEPRLMATMEKLAQFLGTKSERLVLTSNSTYGMNVVASSLDLESGDEVLLTNHEYGAVQRIWQIRTRKVGAQMRTAYLPNPLTNTQDILASIEKEITPRTRIVVVSQISSPTAVRLPIAEIARLCRKHQILCCVDGPHGVVQDPVQLDELGCDFYTASCHKWLCAPAGTGFLYVHTKHWGKIKPFQISWGRTFRDQQARWQDDHAWVGTDDYSRHFAISDAIDFMQQHGLTEFRAHQQRLSRMAFDRLTDLFQTEPLFDASVSTFEDWFAGMAAVRLPQSAPEHNPKGGQLHPWQQRLVEEFQIEALLSHWHKESFLRLSFHWYNTEEDIDRVVDALKQMM